VPKRARGTGEQAHEDEQEEWPEDDRSEQSQEPGDEADHAEESDAERGAERPVCRPVGVGDTIAGGFLAEPADREQDRTDDDQGDRAPAARCEEGQRQERGDEERALPPTGADQRDGDTQDEREAIKPQIDPEAATFEGIVGRDVRRNRPPDVRRGDARHRTQERYTDRDDEPIGGE